jgi:sodium transport system permease protein
VARIENLLQAWGSETAVLRLVARGVSPALVRPVSVARIDVASEQARAQTILGMVSMFVLLAAFVSGVGIAIDATAGERERKSLEPLLVNPVSRLSLILGKWLAASMFSTAGLALVLALNLTALHRVPLEQLGISFIMGPREIVGILLATFAIAYPIIGGLSSLAGTLLAVIFIQGFLLEGLRFIGDWRSLMFGVLIVVVMLVRPGGFLNRSLGLGLGFRRKPNPEAGDAKASATKGAARHA